MNILRILYKNLHIILSKEISKLNDYMNELKSFYHQQDTQLNVIMDTTTKILQGYQLIECEISGAQKKIISIGERITSSVLKKIFKIKNPNEELIYLMKIVYDTLKGNIDINEDNSMNEKSTIKEEITWEFLKEKLQKKSVLLFLSYISETSNFNLSQEIMKNSDEILKKYSQYKTYYEENFPEINIIIEFIEVLMVYYKKLSMLKKLYISNQNKSNKLETIQSDMDKSAKLITKTKLLFDKVAKDYENYLIILKKKDKSNSMIYGYNLIEKYGIYEKYTVTEEYITNDNDYNSEFYSNYGGSNFNKVKKKIRYDIKLKKEYRKKEKFIEQLTSSLISYTKGIRKINREKFMKAINENRNTSINKKSSKTSSLNKSNNKNNMSINISANNILMRSMESNNSSINLKGSFQTNPTNPIFNQIKFNNSPFRNENSRNTNTILLKRSFIGSYQTFDDFSKVSNKNKNLKEGLNISSNDGSQTQTKNTVKTIINSHELNLVKNPKGKNRNAVNINNINQKQVNIKLENEQYSICSFCCKNLENNISGICDK